MKSVNKILFVCLGNICRSPMAEGVFRAKAQELGLSLQFDSCGTGGWHAGEAPDRRAQQCIREHGLDISDLRARKFRQSDFQDFDIIFTMDRSNYEDVIEMANSTGDKEKVRMILSEIYPGENISVPDPYYGGDQGFEHVFDLLNRSADKVLSQILHQ
ncbi:MAG: low molecular weight protein-tyrosine-phosphatase [Flavobacteriales bacterium]